MTILGLDYGEKRIGIAYAPDGVNCIVPLDIIPNTKEVIADIKHLVQELSVSHIIVGLPLSLNGGDSKQTEVVRNFIKQLEHAITNCTVIAADERYSTSYAKGLELMGGDRRSRDSFAAMTIIQTFLDTM